MNTQQNKPTASATDTNSRSQASSSPAPSNASAQTSADQPTSIIDSALASGRSALDSAVESGRSVLDSAVETGRTALDSGKKWIGDAHLRETVDQTTQSVKDWSGRAAAKVGNLSTTQKVVGGAILAAGLGWLAYRKVKASDASSSESSDSSPRSVYGRSGSFTRTGSAGYQAPDASNRRPANTSNRPASMPSFGGESSAKRPSDSGFGGASTSDFSSRASGSGSSYRSQDDDYRTIE
ncbi:hypothetical protein Q5H93_00945 [Hymenobacter sp. ASUV-10]|uniref:YtxH domain-containing protein n=1 Tax=Hymenobacter aranciens TaxID=3063996 RepID=A0ABT9B9A8_9BACT|nr:hypothetical protein [Hymenobacter sp. ASUV-10]MDO7873281.1 hypothetical protein [Hymenobacter sp. ASUV-10]